MEFDSIFYSLERKKQVLHLSASIKEALEKYASFYGVPIDQVAESALGAFFAQDSRFCRYLCTGEVKPDDLL